MRRARSTSLAVLISVLAGCGGEDMRSTWSEGDPMVELETWESASFEREKGLEIGVLNDGQNVFVCLFPNDPGTEVVLMRQGATVWFDGEGDPFGLRIVPRTGSDAAEGDWTSPHSLAAIAKATPRDIEVLTADQEVSEVRRPGEGGVDLRVVAGESLYYVLKVPLARTDSRPIAVGASPGSVIGFGLQTPEFRPPEWGGRGGDAPGSPRQGMPPPGGPQGRARIDFRPPEPIALFAKLRLAVEGSV